MSGYGIFKAVGIELEYMIVEDETLDVLPAADRLIRGACGRVTEEFERGPLAWSNELALHVIEFKTNGPAVSPALLPDAFQKGVNEANEVLRDMDARLMPGAMHPWMNPFRELRLWPHEYSAVYDAYNRIFDCRGHGWANLQSTHINLPFSGDEEFARLHAAIRLLLPVIPALAASSPFADARNTGMADYRMYVYRGNSARVPSVAGRVIPEPVFSRADYTKLLESIYADIAPLDPDGVLQYEWLNSRGAIARFMRDTIEIRVIDMQECPAADIAVAAVVIESLKSLAAEKWGSLESQMAWEVGPLEEILDSTIAAGENAMITNTGYLSALGYPRGETATAHDLWSHLIECAAAGDSVTARLAQPLEVYLSQGTLASRLLRSAGDKPTKQCLDKTYRALCRCLDAGRMFRG